MREMPLWQMIALPILLAILLLGLGMAGAGSLVWVMSPDRPAESTEMGRYAFVSNGTSGLWLLDTATGRIRVCETSRDATSPTCETWSD